MPRRIIDRGIGHGVGAFEMEVDPKRKSHYADLDRAKRARRRLEEVLDDALKNTFPASDPVSIVISEEIKTEAGVRSDTNPWGSVPQEISEPTPDERTTWHQA